MTRRNTRPFPIGKTACIFLIVSAILPSFATAREFRGAKSLSSKVLRTSIKGLPLRTPGERALAEKRLRQAYWDKGYLAVRIRSRQKNNPEADKTGTTVFTIEEGVQLPWANSREKLETIFPLQQSALSGREQLFQKLLIANTVYGFQRTLEELSKWELPAALKEEGRLFLYTLTGKRWSMYRSIQNLKPGLLQQLDSKLSAWLEKTAGFHPYSRPPAVSGLWDFALAAHCLEGQDYAGAVSLFTSAAALFTNPDSRDRAFLRLLTQGMARSASILAANTQKNRKAGPAPQKGLPPLDKELAGKWPQIFEALAPVIICDSESGNHHQSRKELLRWKKYCQTHPWKSALNFMKNDHRIAFRKSKEGLQFSIATGPESSFIADTTNFYWKTEKGTFLSKGTYSGKNRVPHAIHFSMMLNISGSLDFKIVPLAASQTAVSWDSLWNTLLERGFMSRTSKDIRYYWLPDPASPLSPPVLAIRTRKTLPNEITIQHRNGEVHLNMSRIKMSERKSSAPRPPRLLDRELARLKQQRQENKLLPVPFAINKRSLNRAMIHISEAGAKASGNPQAAYENRMKRRIFQDLNKLGPEKTAATRRLAQKYAKQGQSALTNFFLLQYAGRLYSYTANYSKATRAYEDYFARAELFSASRRGEINLSFNDSPRDNYIDCLMHSGRYQHAERVLTTALQEISAQPHATDVIRTRFKLAENSIRTGNWQKAQKHLGKLLQFVRQNKPRTGNREDGTRAMLEDLEAWRGVIASFAGSNKTESLTTLPFLPNLPGQGRSFCAPVAAQFILRFLKKQSMSQKEIARQMQTSSDKNGTEFSAIAEFFQKHNIRSVPFAGSLSRLDTLLGKGIPVLAILDVPRHYNQQHITAIVGIDKKRGKLFLYEPDNPKIIVQMDARRFSNLQVSKGGLCLAFPAEKKMPFPTGNDGTELIYKALAESSLPASAEEQAAWAASIANRAKLRSTRLFTFMLRALALYRDLQQYNKKQAQALSPSLKKRVNAFLKNTNNTKNYLISYYRGALLKILSRPRQAAEAFKNSARLEKDYVPALMELVNLLQQEKKWKAAEEVLLRLYERQDRFQGFPSLERQIAQQLLMIAYQNNQPKKIAARILMQRDPCPYFDILKKLPGVVDGQNSHHIEFLQATGLCR